MEALQDKRSPGERFEQFVTDVIYDRAKMSPAARALAAFLRALSVLFERIVRLRFLLYRTRILRDTPLGCKVVVVGNLTVGGTGKTPVVEKMARVMASHGRKVAILSRGYKSKKEPLLRRILRWLNLASRPAPRIVSDGKNVLLGAEIAGDEPYMLARNLVSCGVCVVVDRDRVYAGEYAIRHFGVDVIILDDGMQYLPLRGSINLLLVDKTNPFGNGNLLPRGILREPVEHLKRGSYIFLTKSDGNPNPALVERIRKYNPDAEIIECTHQPKRLCAVFGDMPDIELGEMRGRRGADAASRRSAGSPRRTSSRNSCGATARASPTIGGFPTITVFPKKTSTKCSRARGSPARNSSSRRKRTWCAFPAT